jgi:hypothetical protein
VVCAIDVVWDTWVLKLSKRLIPAKAASSKNDAFVCFYRFFDAACIFYDLIAKSYNKLDFEVKNEP